ncbi:MAG: hypothetical protein IPM70_18820 [Proteobacteria bacterium]|nr:hypothetical protein [Pseudomonadota bacterium]
MRETQDEMLRDLHPSRQIVWNGNRFTTNSFGMRDREYLWRSHRGFFASRFWGRPT